MEKAHSPATGWRALWAAWKRIARRIADVQIRIMLMVFYCVVLAPFGVAVRLFSDSLAIKAGAERGWRERQDEPGTPMERAARQF